MSRNDKKSPTQIQNTIAYVSRTFAQAKNREELYQMIVDQAKKLGFSRARLYTLDEKRQLHGRAASGIRDSERKRRFENEFIFSLDEDPTSPTTFSSRDPQLYLRVNRDHPETSVRQREPNIHEFSGPLAYEEELERHEVGRWFECSLFLSSNDGSEQRAWGKLSLDNGPDFHEMTDSDHEIVALYCREVMHALALMTYREHEEQQQRLRQFNVDLVSAMKPGVSTLDQVIELSLRLLLEVTGGEIGLYRRFDPQVPQSLRVLGKPCFIDSEQEETLAVPQELPDSLPYSGFFRHFVDDDRKTEKCYILDDPAQEMEHFVEDYLPQLPEKEKDYVQFIQSEMHIPVFRGDEIVGVIVLVSGKRNAFAFEDLERAEFFVHAVSLGLESARDREQWLDIGSGLRRSLRCLEVLADIPLDRDDAFFASLGTLLTSHLGLGWNRAFCFSCLEAQHLGNDAVLMYALGGLATEDGLAQHLTLQRAVANPSQSPSRLLELVKHRSKHPAPHISTGMGTLRDQLYELCVEEPNEENKPILVSYHEPSVRDVSQSTERTIDNTNPIGCLLKDGVSNPPEEWDPLRLQMKSESPDAWIQSMNQTYPGMFHEDRQAFAFLLRGTVEQAQAPLGVIVVDMQEPYTLEEDDMIAATRILLRFASELLARRVFRRQYLGNITTLPVRAHNPNKIRHEWEKISAPVEELIRGMQRWKEVDPDRSNDPELVGDLLRALEELLDDNPNMLDDLPQSIKDFTELLNRITGVTFDTALPGIKDMGAWLDRSQKELQSKMADAELQITWDEEVEGLSVPVYPTVLKDAFGALLDNSRAINCIDGKTVNASIHASVENTSCPSMPKVVVLTYTDDGVGIDVTRQRYIMLDGFTSDEDPTSQKGRGLAIIKRQLLEYHGDLIFEVPHPREGVRFVIQLGIPTQRSDSGRNENETSHRVGHSEAKKKH